MHVATMVNFGASHNINCCALREKLATAYDFGFLFSLEHAMPVCPKPMILTWHCISIDSAYLTHLPLKICCLAALLLCMNSLIITIRY